MRRKGFLSTLESILASFLFLIFIVVVLPNFVDSPSEAGILEDRVKHIVRSLDRSGELRDDVLEQNVSGLEQTISPYLGGFDMEIGLSYLNRTEGSYTGGSHGTTFQVNKSQAERERLLLWVDAADQVSVTINGNSVLTTNSTGFMEERIGQYTADGRNTLNISSTTGQLHYSTEIYNYLQSGELPADSEVFSWGHTVAGANSTYQPSEIQVFVWQ